MNLKPGKFCSPRTCIYCWLSIYTSEESTILTCIPGNSFIILLISWWFHQRYAPDDGCGPVILIKWVHQPSAKSDPCASNFHDRGAKSIKNKWLCQSLKCSGKPRCLAKDTTIVSVSTVYKNIPFKSRVPWDHQLLQIIYPLLFKRVLQRKVFPLCDGGMHRVPMCTSSIHSLPSFHNFWLHWLQQQ